MKTCIMIRKTNPLRWVKYGEFPTMEAAEEAHRENIAGKGITAWSEFVSPAECERMLRDQEVVQERR